MNKEKLKIAAMSDIHVQATNAEIFRQLFEQISEEADILVLAGDLTDHGTEAEAKILAEQLKSCRVPVVGVMGNHDYTHGEPEKVRKALANSMHFLEDGPFTYREVGFAGVKGFGGGFDDHMLAMFGEKMMRDFVSETINETLALEASLQSLTTARKVAVLHYAPISQTVSEEPKEIFPFLGSSRLAEPIDNFGVSVAFHGHAHRGPHHGTTKGGVAVYNVAYPILQVKYPKKPFLIYEV